MSTEPGRAAIPLNHAATKRFILDTVKWGFLGHLGTRG